MELQHVSRHLSVRCLVLLACFLFAPPAAAQERADERPLDSAPVEVDGAVLFRVRGAQAFPADQRAEAIAGNITALAADRSFAPESLRVEEHANATRIVGGPVIVMYLTDEDARLEGFQRTLVAPVYLERVRRAIAEYRVARTQAHLMTSAGRAIAAIFIGLALLALLRWLLRRAEAWLESEFQRRTSTLADESRQILRVEGLWQTLRGALGVVRLLILLAVGLFLLEYVLAQFPWTRGIGLRLFEYVAGPLGAVGQSIVAAIPNLVFLAILFLIARYLLSLARLYFDALQRGSMHLRGFEPEWAQPTYNIVRVALIATAVVIAYPYIPGSESEAFKGLSILVGVMLSLGSTSAIANIVAGYMIIYRRAFRAGELVKIGQVFGKVTHIRMQVTHVRTFRNEEITIPNSAILSSEVMNYSRPAQEGRLILHTEVGIGYETPWRQVEAMLIEAARRTPGLLHEPPPFVLQRQLGDFAVVYQVNAYSDLSDAIPRIHNNLHRNILDQFNEHGVQIMTPAYEGDPKTPKIVAKDQWFAAPARKEDR